MRVLVTMLRTQLWLCIFVLCVFNLTFQYTYGLALPPSPDRHVCVIGAGISGLAAARYLQQYGVNFTVFEATRHIGGTWHFDSHVGTDEYGVPVFTSMYKNLRTNTPRQTMEFGGFSFPEGSPSYPAGPCYYKYLKLFVKHFDLMKFIQFQKLVTGIKWADSHWEVTTKQSETGNLNVEHCDFVFIANGHYTQPVWPKIEGKENFQGNMIHSHDYREPEPYRNRRVLIVGAGASGLDLVTHLIPYVTKLVHSHHLTYNQPDFPKNFVKKPDIKMFTSNSVVFTDGSAEEIDDVIFCTGYDFDHSFLDENAGVTTSGKFVLPLYQHLVNIRHPTMMFIGLTRKTITRVLDAQAEYAAALTAGKFKLPPKDAMLKSWLMHVYDLQKQDMKIVDVNLVGPKYQDQYFANLTAEAGITRAPPVLTDIMIFNGKIRLDDLLNYRDYDFTITDDNHYERKYNPRKELDCPIDL